MALLRSIKGIHVRKGDTIKVKMTGEEGKVIRKSGREKYAISFEGTLATLRRDEFRIVKRKGKRRK